MKRRLFSATLLASAMALGTAAGVALMLLLVATGTTGKLISERLQQQVQWWSVR